VSVVSRLAPRSITAQITAIVIAAVLLGVGLASALLLYLFYDRQAGPDLELVAAGRAARIAAIVRMAEATRSPAELAELLRAHRLANKDVEEAPLESLDSKPNSAPHNPAFVQSIKAMLEETWGITPVPGLSPSGMNDTLAVKINGAAALVFDASPHTPLHNIVLIQTICAVAIITFITLFLSLYAVRWITSPLSSIALAARSFGRSADVDATLETNGPREIAQVAEALNDMRKRVRTLVNERTQMLAAISHDLRTPLTRLRLRAERLTDVALRENMLRDIATINDMLSETLAYLREGGRSEPNQLVDLPSMLQTICAQFVDVGFNATYEGPDRHAFICIADALSRAVTNIVDNGTKHGAAVTVALRIVDDATVQIEVCDDGPGIPEPLRDKVFEPFFKGDSARPTSGRGFGLGLSIARDIVGRQNGGIELLDNVPCGLKVRLTLGMQRAETLGIIPSPANASVRRYPLGLAGGSSSIPEGRRGA
jgi:signal transduction histidine kinase